MYNRLAVSKMIKEHNYLYGCVGIVLSLYLQTRSKKDYLTLATTQYKLTLSQIIQLYARRWPIETYFKTAKQFLALINSKIKNYDGRYSYIATTTISYGLLAWRRIDKTMMNTGRLILFNE